MKFSFLLSSLPCLFAQNGGGGGGAAGGGGGTASPFSMWPAIVVMAVAFYFLLIRPQRREQATRKTMLSALKKNDHVVTVGGIYGVVANVRPEADEVTLKVDEASNTKLRVTLSSIARVVGEETAGDKTAKSS